jgi:hypothetical protein
MCYKSPWGRGREKRCPSTLAGGPWRRPLDIKLGRNYPLARHDQGSGRPATKDCSLRLQRTTFHYFSTIHARCDCGTKTERNSGGAAHVGLGAGAKTFGHRYAHLDDAFGPSFRERERKPRDTNQRASAIRPISAIHRVQRLPHDRGPTLAVVVVVAILDGKRHTSADTGISCADAWRATEQRFTRREHPPTGWTHQLQPGTH